MCSGAEAESADVGCLIWVLVVHWVRPLPGCAPGGAVPFLCFAKEKEPKERRPPSPVGLGPTALRCSVFAGRAELATRPLAAALKQPPEVRGRRRYAPLQSPALLDGSEGPQEQYGRLLRKLSLSTPRCAWARSSSSRCAARRVAKKSQHVCGLSSAWRGPAEPL